MIVYSHAIATDTTFCYGPSVHVSQDQVLYSFDVQYYA